MAAKWRHTIWMFLGIHKTLSVIHVIEGFRSHIINFYRYYAHLTSLEPIFWSSEQHAQNKPRSPPPPPKKKKINFIEQNDFVMQQNQQDPHILDQSDAFCSHPVCKRSYKRPKCALISARDSYYTQFWNTVMHSIFKKLSSSFMNIVQEALVSSSRAWKFWDLLI